MITKEEIIKNEFKKAIEQITGKEHYYICDYWADFTLNGKVWKIKREGRFFINYSAEIDGFAAFSNMELRISDRTYYEIKEMLELKILSINSINS